MRHFLFTSFCLSTAAAQGMWVQAMPATIPVARQGHAMAFDPVSQRVVMFGGASGASSLADLWQWTGTNWNAIVARGLPALGRSNCGFCSDGAGGMLVFGGYYTGFAGPLVRNDTIRFQGGVWTQLFPAVSPGARQWHAMVATPQGALLFGGTGMFVSTLYGDTWRWNGTTWTQLSPTTSPAARYGHRMAFDVSRGVVVLFGGASATIPGLLADTWEWNGTTWAQCTPVHAPPAQAFAAMAFSPVTNKTVLFGEPGGSGATWTWDGTDWQQLTTAGDSFTRWSTPLAFGPGSQGAVLFGGVDLTGTNNETFQFFDDVASLTAFGTGCTGPNALVPSLAGAPGELPRVGTTMHFRVGNLPAGFTVPMLVLGLSNTISGGPPPYPLPFDLGLLGWTGCQQLVSLDATAATASFGTFVDFPFNVPLATGMLGFQFHGQAIVFYPSNDVAVSNGVTAIVGT